MVLGMGRAAICDDCAGIFSLLSLCSRDARRTEEDEMKVTLLKICELSFFFAGLSMAQAQQSIGTVGVEDATVAGAREVSNGRAILVGNTTVTARDRVAEVVLDRGGKAEEGAESGVHLAWGEGERLEAGSLAFI